MPFHPLEQTVLRELRGLENEPRSVLVACSGGVDSMVMLEILWRLRDVLPLQLRVAHVHHGPGNSPHRENAWRQVRDFCAEKSLPWMSNSTDGQAAETPPRQSESSLREFRWQRLRAWRATDEMVAVGHHWRDLLETRMMRLIRGTGAQGIAAMKPVEKTGRILRPILTLEKSLIRDYAAVRALPFLEDPTNQVTDPLRNWLRGWLEELDTKQPNGSRNLSRSLSKLVKELGRQPATSFMTDGGIDRRIYLGASREGKKSQLARYCFELGLKNYTQGHVEELVKRLDDRQKHFTFELLRCEWQVSPEWIKASRASGGV